MPVWTPPTVQKSDLEFHEIHRFVAQKDATGQWLTWMMGGTNGNSVYTIPLTAAGAAVATQVTGSNVEGTPGQAPPPKAVQFEGSDGTNGRVPYAALLNADGIALGSVVGLSTFSQLWGFNRTTWDRVNVIPGATGVLATPASGTQSVAITTITTTAVKASAGVLGTISNANNAAVTGRITIYDNTSAAGKVIWDNTLTAGQALALGIPCGTGITIVTAAADKLAVSYA